MKKTLLVTIDFWPKVGGVANYYFNLAKNLDQDRIFVLTTKDNDADDRDLNFKIVRKNLLLRLPVWPKWICMFCHVLKMVKKEGIEMIWVGEVLPTGTVVYYLSKIFRIPYMVSCHGNDLLQARKVGRREKMAGKVLRAAKYVSVNSAHTGELVKSFGVLRGNIKIVNPGVDPQKKEILSQMNEKYDLKGKKILLSIGRLVERKGFDRVIEVLPRVWKKYPDLVYVLIGSGSDEERLKNMIGNEKRIVFVNKKISEAEKWSWLGSSDLFIMPARSDGGDVEGFGIVYLEANIAGLPVIAGRAGGVGEAVKDGVSGLLVDPENSDEIYKAIVKMFENGEFMKKMGSMGKKRASDEFSWFVITQKFKELLK
jgi:phosphatidyl-myo-inositol dimannoside synthase